MQGVSDTVPLGDEASALCCCSFLPGKTLRMIHRLAMETGKEYSFNEKAAGGGQKTQKVLERESKVSLLN